jgi:hypothetical protein
MKKTLKLINHYYRILREQDEQNPEDVQEFDTSGGEAGADVLDDPEQVSQEEIPLTSVAENGYISELISAALFEPTPEEKRILQNLESAMNMKRFKNAKDEILPTILALIKPVTDEVEIADDLNKLS